MFKLHVHSKHSETLFIYILLCYLTVFSDCDDTSSIKNCKICATDELKLNFDDMKEAIDLKIKYIVVADLRELSALQNIQICAT